MKVLLILSSIIAFVALGLEVKYYQRKSISSSTISKQVAYPNSDMQCCQACSNELDCDGVKYDGNICSLLKDVKISNGSDESVEEEAWVNFELTCKKGHCGNRCQDTGAKCWREISLTVEGSSSVWSDDKGPEKALTTVGFWHSANENKPWIAFEMSDFEYDVVVVEVEDRKYSGFPEDWYARFTNVEVSVGTDSDVNNQAGKTSCGVQSYQWDLIISYKYQFI